MMNDLLKHFEYSDNTVKAVNRMLLVTLYYLMDKKGNASASLSELSAISGLNKRTVISGLKSLKDSLWITYGDEVDRSKGCCNVYHLNRSKIK